MQNQPSLQILTFNSAHPLAAMGVQGDFATCSAIGCYALSVVTSILTGDSTQITEYEAIDPDIVVEQARTILEDVPVHAFKLGLPGSVENVAAIAEILADYPDIPLIVDPFSSILPEQAANDQEITDAINELILPQTTLFIASYREILQLTEEWVEPPPREDLTMQVQRLTELNGEYVLVTSVSSAENTITNFLYDESGLVQQYSRPRISGSFFGAGTTLSAAITALLANGLSLPAAILEAQEFTHASLLAAERLGMGKLIPNRYFWVNAPDEDTSDDSRQASPPK